MKQVEEMGKQLADALHAVAAAESKAAVAEVLPSPFSPTHFSYTYFSCLCCAFSYGDGNCKPDFLLSG